MAKDVSAPPALEIVRSFVNTLDVERPEGDALGSGAAAAAWLRGAGIPVESPPDEQELRLLRAWREAIRAELLAHTGEQDATQAWAGLCGVLDGVVLTLRAFAPGSLGLEPRETRPVEALRAAVAAAIYDAVRDGTWRRLKACRKDSCLFAFFDRSKNASGSWCDMAVCGNRAKAERRRARERNQP